MVNRVEMGFAIPSLHSNYRKQPILRNRTQNSGQSDKCQHYQHQTETIALYMPHKNSCFVFLRGGSFSPFSLSWRHDVTSRGKLWLSLRDEPDSAVISCSSRHPVCQEDTLINPLSCTFLCQPSLKYNPILKHPVLKTFDHRRGPLRHFHQPSGKKISQDGHAGCKIPMWYACVL